MWENPVLPLDIIPFYFIIKYKIQTDLGREQAQREVLQTQVSELQEQLRNEEMTNTEVKFIHHEYYR